MQIIADNTRTGELVIQIDTLDDLWVLYNIIRKDDRVRSRTYRRVVMREGDSGERKPMTLTLRVENVEFYEFSNRLRILGTILEGPDDFVAIGEHHTFNIEAGTKLTIYKDQWLRSDIERIRKNLERKDQNIMLAIAIESGLANVALLSNYSLTPVTEIHENIPGKRYEKQAQKESIASFFGQITTVVMDHLQRYQIGMIVLCGPGFVKEQYADQLRENLKGNNKAPEIRTLGASSGEISAIHEILKNGTVASLNADLTIAQDGTYMAQFTERLGKGEQTIVYGINETELAAQMGAIDVLMICDVYLRVGDIAERKRIDEILNTVEKNRGKIHIMSTETPAGDQLLNYGKIAALLRFRINL
jgi:protein pelota